MPDYYVTEALKNFRIIPEKMFIKINMIKRNLAAAKAPKKTG
jgi:hypothetical protein